MRTLAIAFIALLTSCAADAEVSSPAGSGAAEPHLATGPNDTLLMSWIEPAGEKRHAVKFASMKKGKWSAPRTIVERSDLFVNWADFPSITADARGVLYAHWLQKSGSGTYSYDVMITTSRDGGRTWRAPRKLHGDATQTEHGFVSIAPLRAGGVGAVWLDGRNMKEHEKGSMQLRYAEIGASGSVSPERVLDARVCECCATGMTVSSRGPVAVYRDRTEEEIRDIGLVSRGGKGWSNPAPIHADGWKIDGCPVNGPQIDSRGAHAVAAWFTGADATGRTYVAFSSNGGASFGKPIRVDTGSPVGRVDVVMLPDSSAIVAWIERRGDTAQVVARRVRANGTMSDLMAVGDSSAARSAGFPRMAVAGGKVYVAWTEPSTPKRIRLATLEVR